MEKENKIIKTGTGTGTGTGTRTGAERGNKENENKKEQYRIVIDKESNLKLEEMLEKVNEDFDTGSVSKSDLAMYVFLNLKKFINADDIKNLRMKHFDERKVLNDLLKISETKSELPEEVRKFLRDHSAKFNKDKKRGLKEASATLAS